MFDGLVTRNAETLEIEPALAESYEHSKDGRTGRSSCDQA